MRSVVVVVGFEIVEFSREVKRIPERNVVQILTSDSANHPFYDRVGHWGVRYRLNFAHFQDSQVGLPSMGFEQPIIVC